MTSKHYEMDRVARENAIEMIGIGTVIKEVVVDKGHRNGPEIHQITSTAIVVIYNQRTHKMVTKLIARPGQIRRYWDREKAPKALIDLAYEHQKMGYNKI